MPLGNRSRRKDILQPFRIFYSLPLSYEEKWLVHHVFETFVQEKKADAIVRIEDPYSLTSKYTGVARSLVATITKSVRHTGSVPVSTSPGNRQQPTAIPCSTAGRIRECIFDQHRQGTIGHGSAPENSN